MPPEDATETQAAEAAAPLDIRKYPNRRYYDATRSCHVTLEQMHQLVRDGHDLRIRDSKTGEEITAKVLAQVILEHDALKLDMFPPELLHQVIRSSDHLLRGFMEQFFNQAFEAFVRSQSNFREYLDHLERASSADWPLAPWRAMSSFAPHWPGMGGADLRREHTSCQGGDGDGRTSEQLRHEVSTLSQQVAELRKRLDADGDARPSGG